MIVGPNREFQPFRERSDNAIEQGDRLVRVLHQAAHSNAVVAGLRIDDHNAIQDFSEPALSIGSAQASQDQGVSLADGRICCSQIVAVGLQARQFSPGPRVELIRRVGQSEERTGINKYRLAHFLARYSSCRRLTSAFPLPFLAGVIRSGLEGIASPRRPR